MGENQRGFKSPVYRMNIQKMKRTTRSQLRKGDRPWGGRLWESHQPTNRNLIRGRRDGTSWHNAAKFPHSVLEVNGAVGWRRFSFLPGETCLALRRVRTRSAQRGDAWGDRAGVSRGHSTEIENRGAVIRPSKLGNPPARSYGKGRTNIGGPTCAPSRNSNHRRVL